MVRDKDTGSENAGIEQTKFGENGEFEFPTGKFRETLRARDVKEVSLKVETIETLKTQYGDRILLCGGGKCVFGNKLIFTKLAMYGIRKPSELIGKTIYLKSVDIVVKGIEKKTFVLEGVE